MWKILGLSMQCSSVGGNASFARIAARYLSLLLLFLDFNIHCCICYSVKIIFIPNKQKYFLRRCYGFDETETNKQIMHTQAKQFLNNCKYSGKWIIEDHFIASISTRIRSIANRTEDIFVTSIGHLNFDVFCENNGDNIRQQ